MLCHPSGKSDIFRQRWRCCVNHKRIKKKENRPDSSHRAAEAVFSFTFYFGVGSTVHLDLANTHGAGRIGHNTDVTRLDLVKGHVQRDGQIIPVVVGHLPGEGIMIVGQETHAAVSTRYRCELSEILINTAEIVGRQKVQMGNEVGFVQIAK